MTRNKMGFGLMEVAQKDSPTAIPNWNNSKHCRNNITNPLTKARKIVNFFGYSYFGQRILLLDCGYDQGEMGVGVGSRESGVGRGEFSFKVCVLPIVEVSCKSSFHQILGQARRLPHKKRKNDLCGMGILPVLGIINKFSNQ